MLLRTKLNGDNSFYMWMRLITFEREVIKSKIKYIIYLRIKPHCRKRFRFAGQLELNLLKMIVVNVGIAKSMDEVTSFKAAHLRDHHGK